MSGFYGPIPEGCDEVIGGEDEVLVDLDTPAAVERAGRILASWDFIGELQGHKAEFWPSRHGGQHLRVTLAWDMPLIVRIAWSVVLGGDVLHAVFSFARGYQRLFRPMEALVDVAKTEPGRQTPDELHDSETPEESEPF
jgi:hypothetical protein